MNNSLPSPPSNYSLIKARFAVKFLRAMRRVQNKGRGGARDRYRRYRAAAHASMASAVGRRRAWSRAVLRKRRNQELRRNPSSSRQKEEEEEEEEGELRRVVPGGEEMGFCRLLGETAHYIICLEAQVQVMTDILNAASSSSS